MTDCPFPPCTANIVLIVEQLRPDDDELTTLRVPEHQIAGVSLRMTCPASLLGMPLSGEVALLLAGQADMVRRMVADQGPPPPPAHPTNPPVRERAPQPYWFRNSGGNPNGPYPPEGPTARPKLRLLPGGNSSASTNTGRDMTSAAEIGAAIERATVIMAEVKGSIFSGGGRLGEALEILNVVRETSVDSLGAPQVARAIDLIDEASLLLQNAIEAAMTYRGSL